MTHFFRYRSSVTGLWVTKAYAQRNPNTTQRAKFWAEEDAHREYIDYLTEEFAKAPAEDKAEWQLEIMDALTEWRRALIGESL